MFNNHFDLLKHKMDHSSSLYMEYFSFPSWSVGNIQMSTHTQLTSTTDTHLSWSTRALPTLFPSPLLKLKTQRVSGASSCSPLQGSTIPSLYRIPTRSLSLFAWAPPLMLVCSMCCATRQTLARGMSYRSPLIRGGVHRSQHRQCSHDSRCSQHRP